MYNFVYSSSEALSHECTKALQALRRSDRYCRAMKSETDDQKIDVHKAKRNYEIALERLKRDTTICEENRFYILDYLSACNLGKTIFEKQKKKIKEKRLLKYLYTLQSINKWLGNKDFKQITQQEIESFITLLEGNKLTVLNEGIPTSVNYAAWTQRDYKVCLRKFYKWLLGQGRHFPGIVSWIDTTIDKKAPPSLSLDEIKKCADYSSSFRGKAICYTLFETGARAEEFLNFE